MTGFGFRSIAYRLSPIACIPTPRRRDCHMRDHTKLRAYELADRLALLVYQRTKLFPRDEVFGLTSQMRRAAVSV